MLMGRIFYCPEIGRSIFVQNPIFPLDTGSVQSTIYSRYKRALTGGITVGATYFELTQEQLENGRDIINRMLDGAVDAAALISNRRRIIYLSKGFTELTGQSIEDYNEKLMDTLKIDGQARIEQVLSSGIRQMGVPMRVGSQLLLTNLIPVSAQNEIIGVMLLVTSRSMVVLKRAIQNLEQAAAPEPVSERPARTSGYTFSDYVGEAENVLLCIEQCQRISKTHHPVLLIGETGVGKEIIADAICHEYSSGRSIPFVKLNCSAIPRDLLESELFGHEKGAFTGATATKKGEFEQAAGGILLLDEIGEMDVSLQSKLLRVLEAKEFKRIGGSKMLPMNARIIASTNQNLKQLVADGKFRMDLYYRLNTFEINIPPLRAHKEDIPLLIKHFSKLDALELEFSEEATGMLMHYDWPGNVRELRNVLNRLYFLYPNTIIGMQQVYNATGEMLRLVKLPSYRNQTDPLPPPTQGKSNPAPVEENISVPEQPKNAVTEPRSPLPVQTLRDCERDMIQRALDATDRHLTQSAALLGISRSTLYEKMKKYGLS